jgi:large conductance mechanosensitive channel
MSPSVAPMEDYRRRMTWFKNLMSEFREFVNRGNVVDLGVAFVMGAAFKTVIDAFAGNGGDNPGVIGGLLGAVFGDADSGLVDVGFTLNGSFIPVGNLIVALINFLLVALVVFALVKAYRTAMERRRTSGEDAPAGPTSEELLADILAELRRDGGSRP